MRVCVGKREKERKRKRCVGVQSNNKGTVEDAGVEMGLKGWIVMAVSVNKAIRMNPCNWCHS